MNSLRADDLDELLEEEEKPELVKTSKDRKSAKNAFELQRQLRSESSRASKPKTKYQMLRKRFCDEFDKICSKYFYEARAKKPLAEIFFFDDRRKLRSRIAPRIVKNVQRALCEPILHTKDEKMKLEDRDSINHHLPDLSISYKLFSQQGFLEVYKNILTLSSDLSENNKVPVFQR